ncbi:MAG: hypothetical protein ACYDCI_11350 [Candidatus Limnocylindrales bacterium]
MASKRIGLIAGGILAGGLLLGTAGLVAAQDPTASPSAGPTTSGPAGMMGGSGTAGMMGRMDAADIKAMGGLHQSMATNGTL